MVIIDQDAQYQPLKVHAYLTIWRPKTEVYIWSILHMSNLTSLIKFAYSVCYPTPSPYIWLNIFFYSNILRHKIYNSYTTIGRITTCNTINIFLNNTVNIVVHATPKIYHGELGMSLWICAHFSWALPEKTLPRNL